MKGKRTETSSTAIQDKINDLIKVLKDPSNYQDGSIFKDQEKLSKLFSSLPESFKKILDTAASVKKAQEEFAKSLQELYKK